jgi:hypothetical protein
MAQYKTGTVSVTNGSATVTGSGTLWSGEIAAGDLFTIVGDNAWYEVASVGSNTSLTLSANYAGTTGSGKSYAISRDFTTRLALPYPQKGDIETASIIKRAFEQIDTETNIATANYSATSAPTANDDSGDGYSIGSWWVNVTSDEAYLCVDSTVGAAVWTKISVDVPSEIVSLLAGQSVSMASLTLSGGTANGVLYLNGSKVATSGSALTFDGTNFGVGLTPSGSFRLEIGGADGTQFALRSTGTTAVRIRGYVNSAESGVIGFLNGGGQYFEVAGSEAMRLTSTGLGIGTSSPGYKLDVNGVIHNNAAVFVSQGVQGNSSGFTFSGVGSNYGRIYEAANDRWALGYSASYGGASTEVLNWNSSGNLGLGVTPSAWGGLYGAAIQVRGGSILGYSTSVFDISQNAYADNSGYKYVTTGSASQYRQESGAHKFYTVGSGTAGDAITFTQAATLTANGNYLVGTTSENSGSGGIKVAGQFALTTSQAFTSSGAINSTAYYVVCYSLSGTCTLTLPTPSTNTGRILNIVVQSAQQVVSASSNVTKITDGSLTTAILPATAGKWVQLWCDGTYWNIIATNV